ncbi:hypothetical protein JEZ13_04245 [bacterium]|nr:hypothetical protein [bacterium]MBI9072930.1 hypothetical protein [Melioribacteraceae bacterium]
MTTNKNIGSDKFMIGIDLKYLLDDTSFWIENSTQLETINAEKIERKFNINRVLAVIPGISEYNAQKFMNYICNEYETWMENVAFLTQAQINNLMVIYYNDYSLQQNYRSC